MPSNFLLFLLDTFQSKGRKISWRQIRLQHLRGLPGGFLLLVKNRADFCSTHNTQLLEEFFARTALSALVGVGFPVLVLQKKGQDTTRPSSIVVRDSCWLAQVRRCQTVSSFALSKLVSCGLCRQFFPSFGGLLRRRLTLCLLR